jgi:glycogen synthase
MQRKIAVLSYETPFAPGGGISAVMKYLPIHMKRASQWPTLVITPFHHKIERTVSLLPEMQLVKKISLPFSGQKITIDILLIERDITWIFLRAEDDKFFAGLRHPYDVSKDQAEIRTHLLRDALIFGVASVRALSTIDNSANWALFLQDWEAACAIFALEQVKRTFKYEAFLTIHNTYDMPVRPIDLTALSINPQSFPGNTVLQRTLPFVKDPVFTVSDQFASDLLEDPLQSMVMAPHLVESLTGRLLGVDNGLFANLGIDPAALKAAKSGNYTLFENWKASKRSSALQSLAQFSPTSDKPLWGDIKKFRRDNIPWFIMAGRDDPRQKGFDLAYQAISNFLANNDNACFLIFPIPGDEGLDGLRFLRYLAEKHPHNVLVLPFLFQDGYISALQGATFGIMPSYYEPFGMANEFYMNGAVGIGRATGGILQQIIPLRSAAAYSEAVKLRTGKYYPPASLPTGILFREKDYIQSTVPDLKLIAQADYQIDGTGKDRIQHRSTLRLFTEISRELTISILDGVGIYQSDRNLYYRLLVNGVNYLQNTFSWQRTAQTYLRYISE